MKKSRLMFSAAVKLLSAAAFFYGTAKTFEGPQTFTKFTYLSGAFSAAALILSLCLDFLQSRGAILKKPQVGYILKYCSVLSSALTLIIYMSAIAPFSSKGFVGAYLGGEGASLCLHVLLPLLAVTDFFVFDGAYRAKNIHILVACIFPSAYAALIFSLGAAGITWGGEAAPYSFLNYASSAGWFGVELPRYDSAEVDIGTAYVLLAAAVLCAATGKMFIAISSRLGKLRAKKRGRSVVYRFSFEKADGENRRVIIDVRSAK